MERVGAGGVDAYDEARRDGDGREILGFERAFQ